MHYLTLFRPYFELHGRLVEEPTTSKLEATLRLMFGRVVTGVPIPRRYYVELTPFMAAYNKNNAGMLSDETINMSPHNRMNSIHAGVKRIMAEARELGRDPSTEYTAKPTEEDLFVRVHVVHDMYGLWNC